MFPFLTLFRTLLNFSRRGTEKEFLLQKGHEIAFSLCDETVTALSITAADASLQAKQPDAVHAGVPVDRTQLQQVHPALQ